MDSHFETELRNLRSQLEQLEKELAAKRPIRVDKIEYKIEKLYVESIDHGVLDLGVHFANEERIVFPSLPDIKEAVQNADSLVNPFIQGEDALAEPETSFAKCDEISLLKKRLADLEVAFEELEEWRMQVETRLCRLEKGS